MDKKIQVQNNDKIIECQFEEYSCFYCCEKINSDQNLKDHVLKCHGLHGTYLPISKLQSNNPSQTSSENLTQIQPIPAKIAPKYHQPTAGLARYSQISPHPFQAPFLPFSYSFLSSQTLSTVHHTV